MIKNAFEHVWGDGSFEKWYFEKSIISFKLKCANLTKEVNELASFRYRALNRQLTKEEKLKEDKFLNEKQKEWLKNNSNVMSTNEVEEMVEEARLKDLENKSFWEDIKNSKKGG